MAGAYEKTGQIKYCWRLSTSLENGSRKVEMNKKVEHYELKSIDDLRPAEYNPRKISEKAAKGLSKSIEDFGDLTYG